MKGHVMRHPSSSGQGWECECGAPLGATRRKAREAQRWHQFDVNLSRTYGGDPLRPPSLLSTHQGAHIHDGAAS